MILRVETGDTIERYVLVKNVNDVAIDAEIDASGDLVDDIEIIDEGFRLEPQTERKAYFKIKVKEEGTTENKINIKFLPVGGGSGVGLSSTVIIIASGEDTLPDDVDDGDDDSDDDGVSVTPGGNPVNIDDKESNLIRWLLIGTGTILLIFLVLLMVVASSYRKNGVGKVKPKKSVKKK